MNHHCRHHIVGERSYTVLHPIQIIEQGFEGYSDLSLIFPVNQPYMAYSPAILHW